MHLKPQCDVAFYFYFFNFHLRCDLELSTWLFWRWDLDIFSINFCGVRIGIRAAWKLICKKVLFIILIWLPREKCSRAVLFPIDNNMREIDFYKFGSVLNFNRVVTTRPYETLSGFGRLTLDLTWFDLHASRYMTLDCAPRFALELRSCLMGSGLTLQAWPGMDSICCPFKEGSAGSQETWWHDWRIHTRGPNLNLLDNRSKYQWCWLLPPPLLQFGRWFASIVYLVGVVSLFCFGCSDFELARSAELVVGGGWLVLAAWWLWSLVELSACGLSYLFCLQLLELGQTN